MTENYRIKFVWRIIRVSTAPASDSLPLGSLRNPFTTCDNSTCTDRLTIQAILPVTIHSHLLGRSEKLHSQYTCIYAVRVSRISRVQKHCQQAVENHHRMEHCVYNLILHWFENSSFWSPRLVLRASDKSAVSGKTRCTSHGTTSSKQEIIFKTSIHFVTAAW